MSEAARADQDAWLQTHTFYCSRIKARLTERQCEINRGLPDIKDAGHQRIGPEQPAFHKYRPSACATCGGPDMGKETSMGMSLNEIIRTIDAVRDSKTAKEAAGKLGLNPASLSWRLSHTDDDSLIDLALSKKFLLKDPRRPKEKPETETPAAETKPATDETGNKDEIRQESPTCQKEQVSDFPKPGPIYFEDIPESTAQQSPPPDVVIELGGTAVILGITYTCKISLHKATI